MNRLKLIFLSCLAFMFLLAGCQSSGDSRTMQETTTPTIADPAALYMQVASNIHTADHLSYYIASTQTTVFEAGEFTLNSQQRLNIQDPGKDTMHSSMTENLQLGTSFIDITEIYENGNGYVTVDGSSFTAPLSTEEISKRYAPAICLDPTLYGHIEGIYNGGRIQITFRKPSAAEEWALPADAEFTDASGYAELDKNGALKESVYTLSYTVGNAAVTQTTKIIMLDKGQVLSPDDAVTYLPIECFDGPKLLEQACSYLLQTENISSTAETAINCQTFSISRNQTTNMTLSGTGKDFYALLDMYINQTNQSRGGETTEIRQSEAFENGMYSISVNGAQATQNDEIDASAMKTYCQDMLIRDIPLPQHITGVTAQETDNVLTLTFNASDFFAEAICSNICKHLYSDAELLHTLSSSYETQSLQCVLRLDKHTGLPLFFSSEYSALHNIEDISYLLESKTEQTYDYKETSGQQGQHSAT